MPSANLMYSAAPLSLPLTLAGQALAFMIFPIFASSGAIPFQSVRRDHFQMPRHRVAASILHVHLKIRMWVFPNETGEGSLQIHALTSIELHAESVVRKRGNPTNGVSNTLPSKK